MSRVQINAYICKLRLLQYGLVDEVATIDTMGSDKGAGKPKKGAEDSGSEEEDTDDLMERRNAFVKRCIRKAQMEGKIQGFMTGSKSPIAAERRREVVKEFFKDIVSVKKCTSCSGYVFCAFYILAQLTVEKASPQVIGEIGIRRFLGKLCLKNPSFLCRLVAFKRPTP